MILIEAIKEISIAWSGGDWGYGSLGELIGDPLARFIVNIFG